VEHVINGDEHQLTAIRDLNTLQDRYQDILRVNSSTSTKGKSWSLSQQGLDDSKEKLETGDEEAARGILKKEKLSTANIEKMVAALSEPIANAAIAIIINHRTTEKQHVCGMAYLEGRDDFWFLQPFEKNDQKWVEFKPGSAKKVKEKFLELLPKEIK
jgi:hypothetical protein